MQEKAEEMSDGKFLKSHVLTNKEVRKIRVNENDVMVDCQDGSSFSADHVILTVSLGVLKEQYKHLFENIHLPDTKVEAIEVYKTSVELFLFCRKHSFCKRFSPVPFSNPQCTSKSLHFRN